MAWIESHQSLLNHRKTGRLARKLGITKITAIGHLHAFWWWCMDNAPDGNLDSIDAEDIADGSGWEGEPADFIDALIYAGFVDGADAEPPCRVHDWYDYVGKLIEKREKDAERKRLARLAEGHAPSQQPPKPVRRTSSGRAKDGAGTVPYLTVPNRTPPNLTKKDASHEAIAAADAPRPIQKEPIPIKQENPQWDALVTGIGVEPKTTSERSRYGKAVKELKAIEATPDDILCHCANYRAHWPNAELTPESLVRHWSKMDHPPKPGAGNSRNGRYGNPNDPIVMDNGMTVSSSTAAIFAQSARLKLGGE